MFCKEKIQLLLDLNEASDQNRELLRFGSGESRSSTAYRGISIPTLSKIEYTLRRSYFGKEKTNYHIIGSHKMAVPVYFYRNVNLFSFAFHVGCPYLNVKLHG